MNNIKVEIWGREFDLEVDFDCFDDEQLLDNQNEAVNKFLKIDFTESLDEIKSYCLNNNGDEIGSGVIDDIFKYVIPKSIYIPRDDENRTAALMCDYKFDIEHGLAVTFENEKFKSIAPQDDIL